VNLLGINSVATPRAVRLEVWRRLATDLRPTRLARIADRVVGFEELPAQFGDYIAGRVTGRTVVHISKRA
jgi:NADPH2:quinone reductase